ncbi:MAG: hypothetical protein QOJ30_2099 [Pseudonocardiales bacterium]|jgi:hypothetical protein|nr:hypothetical protein [Pseudonocardiales bacterium]
MPRTSSTEGPAAFVRPGLAVVVSTGRRGTGR